MGSGLILLLIVGAWLAVLVPMALRSSEAASALSTVDRFSDAMRVLSRRSSAAAGAAASTAPGQTAAAPTTSDPTTSDPTTPGQTSPGQTEPAPVVSRRRSSSRPAARLTPAARRRRAVGLLVLLAAGSLVGGVLGPRWLLGVHAVIDALLLAVFLWLRSQAVLREERQWRAAMGDRRSAGRTESAWSPLQELSPAPVRPAVAVYGVPDRMPARREIASTDSVFDQYADVRPGARSAPLRPAVVPGAVAHVPPARGAKGEPWQPVPVPVPMYVTAPRAPRRVVDLTVPSQAETLASAERSVGIDDRGPELDHILDRRAVGG